MKSIFFVLVSLNVVLFVWESFGHERSGLMDDAALRRIEDPSIDRIILAGESPAAKNLPRFATNQGGPHGFNRPRSNQDPAIFQSVNQGLFESIEQQSTGLVEDLLESEVIRQINAYQNGPLIDFQEAPDLNRQSNLGELCCPEFQLRAEFRSLDGSLANGAQIRESRPPLIEPAGVAGNAISGMPADSNSAVQAGEKSEVKAGSEKLCYKLGPRSSGAGFSRIAADIRRLGLAPSVKAEGVDVETGFMVLYPAAESFEASKTNVKKLNDKGLRDLWMINDGTLRGSISLGFFKTRERAEILRQELEAKQVEARVQAKLSKRTAYFLVFPWPLVAGELHARLLESGFAATQLNVVDPGTCEP